MVGRSDEEVEGNRYQMKEKGSDKGERARAIIRDDDDEPWPCGSTQNRPILPLAFLTYYLQSMIHLIRAMTTCAPEIHFARTSIALPPLFSAPVATHSDLARLGWASSLSDFRPL
jgi:hypothetical protein